MDPLNVLCAQLTRDLFATAKFLFSLEMTWVVTSSDIFISEDMLVVCHDTDTTRPGGKAETETRKLLPKSWWDSGISTQRNFSKFYTKIWKYVHFPAILMPVGPINYLSWTAKCWVTGAPCSWWTGASVIVVDRFPGPPHGGPVRRSSRWFCLRKKVTDKKTSASARRIFIHSLLINPHKKEKIRLH